MKKNIFLFNNNNFYLFIVNLYFLINFVNYFYLKK